MHNMRCMGSTFKHRYSLTFVRSMPCECNAIARTQSFCSFSETTNVSKKWGSYSQTICYNSVSSRVSLVCRVYEMFSSFESIDVGLIVIFIFTTIGINGGDHTSHSITALTEYLIRSLNHVLHSDSIFSHQFWMRIQTCIQFFLILFHAFCWRSVRLRCIIVTLSVFPNFRFWRITTVCNLHTQKYVYFCSEIFASRMKCIARRQFITHMC